MNRARGKILNARGSKMLFKATHASTNGAFSLMERTLPPGGRKPPPHIHTNCEEAFYVLEGQIEFFLGTETVIGRPGSFVHVPGGVSHIFGNAQRFQHGCCSFMLRRWTATLKNCEHLVGKYSTQHSRRTCVNEAIRHGAAMNH